MWNYLLLPACDGIRFFYKNLTVIVYFPYHPKSPFYNSNLPLPSSKYN